MTSGAAGARLALVWSVIRRRAGGSSEFDLLSRTFFARFFDNDITGGSSDLKASFFWLLAFLAVPGMAIPVLMSFNWDVYAQVYGTDALRIASRGDKAFYLGFAMIASGMVSAIVWDSLLIDRLDCLVLGTLPVPGPRIVRAKLTALCTYILTVTVAMHALASGSYGFFLAAHSSLAVAWAGTVAHMVASCAASAFVLFAIAAAQGVLVATLGPRRFSAVSPWLQAAVMAVVLLGLMSLPLISTSTVETLAGAGEPAHMHAWILRTPPLWFLGLYEVIMRTDDPALVRLSGIALTSLIAAATITLIAYPIAYRRLVSSVVEMTTSSPRHGWAGRLVEWTVSCVSRNSQTRASSQFFLTALRRSARHRIAMAMAGGATVAFVSPVLFRWAPRLAELPATPGVDLLALPFEAMLFILVGLRVAAALPSDLSASWVLDSIDAPAAPLRSGLWRTMYVTAVIPVSVTAAVLFGPVWGARFAVVQITVCLLFGAVLIEGLLWGFDALPCSRPWRPEHAGLRKLWPAYLALFLAISIGLPALERIALDQPPALAALVGGLALIGVTMRVTHHRRQIMPREDFDEPADVQVLNLNG